jgi:hypothetical protein
VEEQARARIRVASCTKAQKTKSTITGKAIRPGEIGLTRIIVFKSEVKMPVPEDPLWKEWLAAENTLQEARDELRTVEHLDLGNPEFQVAWVAYRLALGAFNEITNKL